MAKLNQSENQSENQKQKLNCQQSALDDDDRRHHDERALREF